MDVAIIGGGVSGCYCAYRLARAFPQWKIALFEASGRFGGRLWSAPIAGPDARPAELGGMFLSDKHHNAFGLVSKELKLGLTPVHWSQRHQYLRDAYIENGAYAADPASVPFALEGAEAAKSPIALLLYGLGRIVPALEDIWPLNAEASPAATYRRLRILRFKDRPLHEWGFWNVLSEVISHEAYALLLSTIGYGSVFRNANALEAIWTLLRNIDPSQRYFSIDGGYQQLPLALLQACKDSVDIRSGWRLEAVSRIQGRFLLNFETAYADASVEADRVVLALPRRALELVKLDAEIIQDREEFQRDLMAVIPAAACKLYLTFDEAWWDKSELGPEPLTDGHVAVAFTDLPMRQCYYFGKADDARGPALLMGAYTDDVACGYWSGLASFDDDSFASAARRLADQTALWCSKAMVQASLKQLGAMHRDIELPAPSGALFVDWGRDPYGAAWHEWAPGAQCWRIGPRMRQPNRDLALFVCGEAFSQRQAWVEGAINSAEMVLRRMGVDPPGWVDVELEFEKEGEWPMNALRELLIALSESLALQRAYARDADAIMTAFGLSDTEKSALRGGDDKAIRSLATGAEVFNVIITLAPK